MTIRIPESRLVSIGPGDMIDPLTGSGVSVRKYQCGYPNLNPNTKQTPVMRNTTLEAWVNRCTNYNRVVQVARVSVKMYVLVSPFGAGPETIEPDSVIDFDSTVIAKVGDAKGMATKSYDLAVGMGYDPISAC